MHPQDLVKVPKEGRFDRCDRCGMQVNACYPRHRYSQECQVGVERKQQRETAVASALALRQQFSVRGDVLERVEVFKYLGRLLSQDDDDIQAFRAQMRKARATWARVGQVLKSENASPFVAARFYQAVVQAILLYGSESWVLSKTAMARLEGFHIRCAYRMAKEHRPKRGPDRVWIYLSTIGGCVEGVRDEADGGVHFNSSADGRGVRSDPSDPRRMQTERAKESQYPVVPTCMGADRIRSELSIYIATY